MNIRKSFLNITLFAVFFSLFSNVVFAQDVVSTAPIANYSFDDGRGSQTLSDSQNGFNGSLKNFNVDEDWLRVEGNGGLRFDGDDKYIEIADADEFSYTTGAKDKPFSFTTYLNTGTLSDSNVIISKVDEQNDAAEWMVDISKRKVRVTLYSKGSKDNFIRKESNEELLENGWYHIAVTYNGSGSINGVNLYLNAVALDTQTSRRGAYEYMTNTSANVLIGSYNNGTQGLENGDFKGTVLDLKTFDKEIPFTQVEQDKTDVQINCTGEGYVPGWLCPIVYQFTSTDRANEYINSRIRLALYILFIVVLILAIGYSAVAGIKYISSSGDQGKMDEAKEAVKAILFGFAAMILAVAGIFLVFLILGGDPFSIPTEIDLGL